MPHVAKYSANAVGHLFDHYGRDEDSKTNRSNENINSELTGLNYNLAITDQPLSQIDFLHKRLSEVKVQKRKDVNVMCDWVVTVPKNLINKKHSKFFKESYNFLCERYGKNNVISAYVHMDEKTPHLHFSFIPVTEDNKKGGFKVSAKELITRQDLKTFHQDLEQYLEKKLGHKVNILNEATRDGNRTISELKQQSALERIHQAEERANNAEIKANKAEEKLKDIQGKILKQKEINALQGKRTLTGGLKGITYEEYLSLKKTAENVDRVHNNNKILKQDNEILKNQVKNEKHNAEIEYMKATRENNEGLCELHNQNTILKKALRISNDAKYNEIQNELENRGLLHKQNNRYNSR